MSATQITNSVLRQCVAAYIKAVNRNRENIRETCVLKRLDRLVVLNKRTYGLFFKPTRENAIKDVKANEWSEYNWSKSLSGFYKLGFDDLKRLSETLPEDAIITLSAKDSYILDYK